LSLASNHIIDYIAVGYILKNINIIEMDSAVFKSGDLVLKVESNNEKHALFAILKSSPAPCVVDVLEATGTLKNLPKKFVLKSQDDLVRYFKGNLNTYQRDIERSDSTSKKNAFIKTLRSVSVYKKEEAEETSGE